ncbi:MAG: MFS transporter [Alphaproteobacteria bacterium]
MSISAASPPPSRRTLYASYAAGMFSMGQAELLTMVVPLWAVLQGVSPTQIGILVGAKSMITFFLAIHGGALMDRLGTRRVMLFFAVVSGALAALYPAMPWFPLMVMLQMLIGFAGNMSWIGAQTIIAQITHGDPGLIGRFSFFSRIGNVIAPLLMGALWDFAGPTVSFLGVSVWAAMMFVAVSQIDSRQFAGSISGKVGWRDVLPRLSDYVGSFRLIVLPLVAFTLAISFMRHATNGVENSFLIVYLRDVGFAGTIIGAMFSLAEIVNGLASLAAGRVARWMPIPWLMLMFTAVSILLLAITPLTGGVLALLALAHCLRRGFEGLVQPLMFSLQAKAVPANVQGSIVGLRVTNNRLSSIITPILMGLIVEAFGIQHGFMVMGGILLAVCAALAVIVARTRKVWSAEL